MIALLPWLAGFLGFGLGLLVVGGNSEWLWAFAYIPVVLGALWVVFSL